MVDVVVVVVVVVLVVVVVVVVDDETISSGLHLPQLIGHNMYPY